MKKIISIFLLAIGLFAFNGCSSKEVVTDVSTLKYLDSSNKENIAYNLNLAASNIKSTSFSGSVEVKGKKYDFSGEIIVNDSLEDSIVHIKYKDNNFYLKKGNLYFSYIYNNTNVVIKDSVDNFGKEIINLLELKGIKCNDEKIFNILKNKEISDLNFENVSKYVEDNGEGYSIVYKGMKVDLNNNYLPINLRYSIKDITLAINFKYIPVKISVPVGYDLVDINLERIKNLLKINNFSELLK